MKKILGLVLGMFLTAVTLANGVVTYADAATAEKSKTEGVFNFKFDSNFEIEEINKTLSRFTESSPKIHFASLNSWLCKEECTPYKAGRLIYYDGSHLDAIVTRDSDVMSDFEVTIKHGVQFE